MGIINFGGAKAPAAYLGDGVYAVFDGYGIWLHANDYEDPTDRIYFEPGILERLIKFNEYVRSEEVIERIKQLNS